MDFNEPQGSPISKRRKLNPDQCNDAETSPQEYTEPVASKSLSRPISPPPSRRKRSVTPGVLTQGQFAKQTLGTTSTAESSQQLELQNRERSRYMASPIQLTRIHDLPAHQNVDTVGLEDVLGDPLIRECWNFNFLFDVDFVMGKLDPDVRSLVKMKIIHGFWRRDDERRNILMETAEQYPNVELISAYIPDPFGTHHSKMLILFRHDDTAQVMIHTANMIPRDWHNMTQAVWLSPLLPIQTSQPGSKQHRIGSGERFKVDLLNYLNAYEKKLRALTEQFVKYDCSAIRAAFIGSAPSRQKPNEAKASKQTSWGWLGVREILSTVPVSTTNNSQSPPNIVIQTSSIATLGQLPTWLTHLQSVLSRSCRPSPVATAAVTATPKASDFFAKRQPASSTPQAQSPAFNIIFPTAKEIRTSLDGYASGFSIHTKLQSAQQQKQLEYLRPLLCHWRKSSSSTSEEIGEAYRGPAAPHIKTYIRFSDTEKKSIDWAMLTSANLSKQAWGEAENKKGEVWIQSWECGVVVWPDLFKSKDDDDNEIVVMVPVFGEDIPRKEYVEKHRQGHEEAKVVGFRMPYDLPLESYAEREVPWCASAIHEELDWKGQTWRGYQPH